MSPKTTFFLTQCLRISHFEFVAYAARLAQKIDSHVTEKDGNTFGIDKEATASLSSKCGKMRKHGAKNFYYRDLPPFYVYKGAPVAYVTVISMMCDT